MPVRDFSVHANQPALKRGNLVLNYLNYFIDVAIFLTCFLSWEIVLNENMFIYSVKRALRGSIVTRPLKANLGQVK